MAHNRISRKYSCEKLISINVSCPVNLVTLFFQQIPSPCFNPLLTSIDQKFPKLSPCCIIYSYLTIFLPTNLWIFKPLDSVFFFFFFCLESSIGTEDYRSKLSGDCFADLACPEKCRCEGTTVDCSNQKLTKIPDHIPQYTAELWVHLPTKSGLGGREPKHHSIGIFVFPFYFQELHWF